MKFASVSFRVPLQLQLKPAYAYHTGMIHDQCSHSLRCSYSTVQYWFVSRFIHRMLLQHIIFLLKPLVLGMHLNLKSLSIPYQVKTLHDQCTVPHDHHYVNVSVSIIKKRHRPVQKIMTNYGLETKAVSKKIAGQTRPYNRQTK